VEGFVRLQITGDVEWMRFALVLSL
jgi:hypothetical protein